MGGKLLHLVAVEMGVPSPHRGSEMAGRNESLHCVDRAMRLSDPLPVSGLYVETTGGRGFVRFRA